MKTMTKEERRNKPCLVCKRPEYAHPGGRFCPDPNAPKPDPPDPLFEIGVYTIVKNDDRYPGIGWEFPAAFEVIGLTLVQAMELAARLSNHEAGCDYAYYCSEDPDV